ncbi:nucleoside monophosphate kinase [Ureaplasma miroungigenitalium]|uniref:Adenylate kinase n=1 Tax=Ureaplasma miroungigenitalium TaxID=1042321 RepID=A0ABT3BMD9_9BACT|nr:nucleoside monophosphate kinase [Ureaplasma miroungigenitalium]MCV3728394.1 nucleoside monophosphate kinase [Ureaplasma miroungigenitalium]MCV3734181.1 nucleoside monophosphate kinase [Ureaplasma miroungigenitalium]
MKLLFLGPPGSGKGSISSLLIDQYQFEHVSTGNLFRALFKRNDDFAKEVQNIIDQGLLVPDEVTNKIAHQAIDPLLKNQADFILDGWPRTINQAQDCTAYMQLDHVIYFDIPEDVLIKRITGRYSCTACPAVYNIFYNPPKKELICDNCQHPLMQRGDDNKTSLNIRMQQFKKLTLPIVEYYEKVGLLVRVNANQPLELVYEEVLKIIKKK